MSLFTHKVKLEYQEKLGDRICKTLGGELDGFNNVQKPTTSLKKNHKKKEGRKATEDVS